MMKRIILIPLLFTIAFFSCSGPDNVYEQHRYFSNGWKRFNKLTFEVPVEEPSQRYDILFSFVHTPEYQYDNIPVHIILNTPGGEERMNKFNLPVRDKSGKYTGTQAGDSIQMQAVLWPEFIFGETGKAKISVEQIIPKFRTPHIKSAGILIKESE